MAGFKGKFALFALFAVLVLATLPGCKRAPDETRVRSAISAAAAAAESASARGVVAHLSEDFEGNRGELDRRALGNLVRIAALRGERVGANVGPIGIEQRGERIIATFAVTLTGGQGLLPDRLGVYQVESAWRQVNGEWRCYAATWKHAL